ncbi:hypothetical protein SpCBS45565_g05055 [Spizellomyces sp. 'palustris']|nr:hypothetical protein SpCBS45565_g05055 [Spizellomyces sp. 'palustris']
MSERTGTLSPRANARSNGSFATPALERSPCHAEELDDLPPYTVTMPVWKGDDSPFRESQDRGPGISNITEGEEETVENVVDLERLKALEITPPRQLFNGRATPDTKFVLAPESLSEPQSPVTAHLQRTSEGRAQSPTRTLDDDRFHMGGLTTCSHFHDALAEEGYPSSVVANVVRTDEIWMEERLEQVENNSVLADTPCNFHGKSPQQSQTLSWFDREQALLAQIHNYERQLKDFKRQAEQEGIQSTLEIDRLRRIVSKLPNCRIDQIPYAEVNASDENNIPSLSLDGIPSTRELLDEIARLEEELEQAEFNADQRDQILTWYRTKMEKKQASMEKFHALELDCAETVIRRLLDKEKMLAEEIRTLKAENETLQTEEGKKSLNSVVDNAQQQIADLEEEVVKLNAERSTSDMDNARKQIAGLGEEVARLKEERLTLEHEREESESRLALENAELKAEKETAKKRIAKLESSIADYKFKLKSGKEHEHLFADNATLKSDLETAKLQISDLETGLLKWQTEHERLSQANKDCMARLSEENSALQAEVRAAQDRKLQLETELASFHSLYESSEQGRRAVEASLVREKSELNEELVRIRQQVEAGNALHAQLEAAQDSLAKDRQETEFVCATLNDQIEALREQLVESTSNVDRLRSERNHYMRGLAEQLNSKEDYIKEKQRWVNEKEILAQENAGQRKQIAHLRKQVNDIKRLLDEATSSSNSQLDTQRINVLAQENAGLHSLVEELRGTNAKLAHDIQMDSTRHEAEINELKSLLERCNKRAEDLSSTNQKLNAQQEKWQEIMKASGNTDYKANLTQLEQQYNAEHTDWRIRVEDALTYLEQSPMALQQFPAVKRSAELLEEALEKPARGESNNDDSTMDEEEAHDGNDVGNRAPSLRTSQSILFIGI